MGNDDKPSNWVEQIGERIAVNDDVDKQHGRTLGKNESATTSPLKDVVGSELEEDKYKGLNKEGEHKNAKDVKSANPQFDRDTYEKNLREAELERDRSAVKDYENRMTKPPETAPPKKAKFLDKVDNLVDKADELFSKTSPYVDDIAKNLGHVGRVIGPVSGAIVLFCPESTAEDDVFWKNEEEKKRYLEEFDSREFSDIDLDSASYELNPPLDMGTIELEQIDYSSDILDKRPPDFIEMEYPQEDMDMGEPGMEGNDGGDGGDGGE